LTLSVADDPGAPRRILDAARAVIARSGTLSIGDVAAQAGVSKALIHYHFRDRDSLLAALARAVGDDVILRETRLLDAAGSRSIDAYWRWAEHEITAGDVRVLASLASMESDAVREQVRHVAARRRALATQHIGDVFEELSLRPRVPPALLAETLTMVIDGMASQAALEAEREQRSIFDALWLAFLSLAE
jgi:AcrR family transcriptional regulator